ncbi:MAG: hypothetical protein PW788_04910 [Micavibrio sp.]|nr:hypothetical protein [Micavibrio sp.]
MLHTSDHQIRTPRGMLYARSWMPGSNTQKSAIMLFHDSLGCVELRRNFPERLAAATGRRIIAYDRLGFGKSDSCRAQLASGFVTDEPSFPLPCQ